MEPRLVGAILMALLLTSSVSSGAAGASDGSQDDPPSTQAAPLRSDSKTTSPRVKGKLGPALTLSVHVQNYAQVPSDQMKPALREAGRVFREAGVQIDWLDCTPNDVAGGPKHPDCDKANSSASVVLRLLPRSMGARMGLGNVSFGYALSLEPGRVGRIANVFVYRIQELARKWGVAEKPVILGHLVAHELGHLVLGVGGHTRTGIMGFPWQKKELEAAVRGSLLFTKEQARRMQSHVRDHMSAEHKDNLPLRTVADQ
jgi:hypothetical protein